jgi:phenylalanine-4-hydroxylase
MLGSEMRVQEYRHFTDEEQETWRRMYNSLAMSRKEQIVPEFSSGLEYLGIIAEKIPNLAEVNERLMAATGWQGVAVEGFEELDSFYPGLAQRKFPIGNFIRSSEDIGYTPAPDIFHDLYGHLPFLVDPDYASFCQQFGEKACQYLGQPEELEKLERLFWFTIEFALIKTPQGLRIFGAGIVSSTNECNYTLDTVNGPEHIPFNVEKIMAQDFRIDEMQKRVFVLESRSQLFTCFQ